ncbi:MAG: hypothetical protein GY811_24370 [Myxococcales bacterium]|nr:hypothetical protein [Myxococcales bacterium]
MGEYRFPLHRQLSGFLFVDGGKVARDVSDLARNKLHLGVSAGLHIRFASRLLLRMHVAASEEGTILSASFSPSDRVRRTTKRR